MKAYLLTYNSFVPQEYVQSILNPTKAVETWLSPFSNTAILLSKLTVAELSAVLHTHFGAIWFIVVEANKDNSNGWLPQQFWDYITDPQKAWSQRILAEFLKPLPAPPGRKSLLELKKPGS